MKHSRLLVVMALAWVVGCQKSAPPAPTGTAPGLEPSRGADGGPSVFRDKTEPVFKILVDPQEAAIRPLFSEGFMKTLPPMQIRRGIEDLLRLHGKPVRLRLVELRTPLIAVFEIEYPRARVPLTVGVEQAAPHLINTFLVAKASVEGDSLDSLLADIKALSGKTSVVLRRLAPKTETLLEWQPNEPLAVGSSFKLFLLAALTQKVADGKRKWDDVVRLNPAWYSYPSGMLQDWPPGSPLTLHTLAAIMLSKSDNTAADHLLMNLGREQFEAALPGLGLSIAARNRPFLATHELFKLKLNLPGETLEAYAKANEAERRKLLADAVAKAPMTEPRLLTSPLLIDQVEWFATAADLAQLLDRFRQPAWEEGRKLLAILPPFQLDEEQWRFVGYKAGAECGVINYSLLLQSKRGDWYTLIVTWNNGQEDVSAERLLAIVDRLMRTLQRREQAEGTSAP